MIRVGPAGWSYPDWEGRVFSRARRHGFHPLRLLSELVDCVEVNASFYALPRAEHAARWAELVAARPDFRFVVKLHQGFTHGPAPEDPAAWSAAAAAFRQGVEPLRRRRLLSALLVQFPASFHFGDRQVRRLGLLHSLFSEYRLVLEVRHQSWFSPPALDTVRGLFFSLAHIDLPAAWNHPPDWHASTGPVGYLRLHGRNAEQWFRSGATRDDRYDYLYSPAEMRELGRKAQRIADLSEETFVITNNHFAGKAVANAVDLLHFLHGRKLAVPAELARSFPHLREIADVVGESGLFD